MKIWSKVRELPGHFTRLSLSGTCGDEPTARVQPDIGSPKDAIRGVFASVSE